MNPQIVSMIRSSLLGVGGGMVSSGLITDSSLQAYVGVATWLSSFGWSLWNHRRDGIIGAAAALTEVSKIVTTPSIAASSTFVLDPKVVAPSR